MGAISDACLREGDVCRVCFVYLSFSVLFFSVCVCVAVSEFCSVSSCVQRDAKWREEWQVDERIARYCTSVFNIRAHHSQRMFSASSSQPPGEGGRPRVPGNARSYQSAVPFFWIPFVRLLSFIIIIHQAPWQSINRWVCLRSRWKCLMYTYIYMIYTHIYIHTYTYIYIYIYVYTLYVRWLIVICKCACATWGETERAFWTLNRVPFSRSRSSLPTEFLVRFADTC